MLARCSAAVANSVPGPGLEPGWGSAPAVFRTAASTDSASPVRASQSSPSTYTADGCSPGGSPSPATVAARPPPACRPVRQRGAEGNADLGGQAPRPLVREEERSGVAGPGEAGHHVGDP